LDVGAVHAYADGFARAVVSGEADLMASYLFLESEGAIEEALEFIPRPIEQAEVIQITAPESDECISLTRFSSPGGEALLRAIWIEPMQTLLIKRAQIVDLKHGASA
jgi:hypothetical protein